MKKSLFVLFLLIAAVSIAPALAHAQLSVSVGVAGSGGAGGSGVYSSDMVFSQYVSGNTGWGWAGGAGGVQGSQSITNTGADATSANEALSFNFSSLTNVTNPNSPVSISLAAINAMYPGGWTIENATLTIPSSYSVEGNSRFGLGSGTFNIYWVADNNWSQKTGTATSDPAQNPPYVTSASALAAWSTGGTALLGQETFTVPTVGQPGYNEGTVLTTYNLSALDGNYASFVNAITDPSTGSGNYPDLSLYLMGTDSTIGMLVFTGGQAGDTPTLEFDVVPTPIPSALLLFVPGIAGIGFVRKRIARHET